MVPALFGRELWADISRLSGDQGARGLLAEAAQLAAPSLGLSISTVRKSLNMPKICRSRHPQPTDEVVQPIGIGNHTKASCVLYTISNGRIYPGNANLDHHHSVHMERHR